MSLARNLMDVDEARPVFQRELGQVIEALNSFGDHGPVLRELAERDAQAAASFKAGSAARFNPIRRMRNALLPVGRDAEAAAVVDGLINKIDRELTARHRLIEAVVAMIDDLVRGSNGLVAPGVMREALMSVLRQPIREHDEMVEHYHQLKVLAAEIDPDATGGPIFDNAEDLIASLRT